MKEIDRRNFLKICFAAMAGLITVILGGPLAAYIFEPFFQEKYREFIKVPGFPSLPENEVTYLNFKFLKQDSFFRKNEAEGVWVIKHAADRATVYSPICTHLGCRVDWQGDWQKFVCPCHGSVFDAEGQVVSGPAPRALDTLAVKIQKGELYVRWEFFKSGVAQKVEI